MALVVGIVGGLYGIGGGSILAPILIALGYSVFEVAPATLAATFLTSVAGIATYQVLQAVHGGTIAPQWILGAFLGAGGFAGSYCGARLQSRLPEKNLRKLLSLIACLVAGRYLQTAASAAAPSDRPQRPANRNGLRLTHPWPDRELRADTKTPERRRGGPTLHRPPRRMDAPVTS
jgi:Sulfite exporter TauE/SafE